MRGFEERTRMQHDKLDEVVDGMLGSSIGQNMTPAEREQMKTMFQKQVPLTPTPTPTPQP